MVTGMLIVENDYNSHGPDGYIIAMFDDPNTNDGSPVYGE